MSVHLKASVDGSQLRIESSSPSVNVKRFRAVGLPDWISTGLLEPLVKTGVDLILAKAYPLLADQLSQLQLPALPLGDTGQQVQPKIDYLGSPNAAHLGLNIQLELEEIPESD